MQQWRLIIDGPGAASWNMAVDESLLENLSRHPEREPVLRFYTWDPPALSLGFFQNQADFSTRILKRLGIVPITRISGGAAALHWGDLTYSVVARAGRDLPFDLSAAGEQIRKGLLCGLKKAGVPADCGDRDQPRIRHISALAHSAPTDIYCQGKKLAGSAQYRRGCSFMQHGTIILKDQSSLVDRIFSKNAAKSKPLSERLISLEQILSTYVHPNEIITLLVEGFKTAWDIDFYTLQAE
jgi:lipoate-protein ligase A